MHGIIFTSFRQFVTSRFGVTTAAAAWAGEPVYSIASAYLDTEFLRVFGKVCDEVGVGEDELLREFGVYTGERTFVLLYPSLYEEAGDARTFLLSVEHRIHDLIRTAVPGARPPRLQVEPHGSDGVRITYDSPRQLCVLLEGLVIGTARHYDEGADVDEVRCMRRGEGACVFEARLSPAAVAVTR